MKRLLVLDDDPDMCAFVVSAATSAGYQATSSTDFDGFAAGLTRDTSLVVLDLMMPEVDGIQVLRYLSSQNYASDIVLISGYDKKVLKVAGQLAEALGLKLRASVQKPVNLKSLQEILRKVAIPSSPRKRAHAATRVLQTRKAFGERLRTMSFLFTTSPSTTLGRESSRAWRRWFAGNIRRGESCLPRRLSRLSRLPVLSTS